MLRCLCATTFQWRCTSLNSSTHVSLDIPWIDGSPGFIFYYFILALRFTIHLYCRRSAHIFDALIVHLLHSFSICAPHRIINNTIIIIDLTIFNLCYHHILIFDINSSYFRWLSLSCLQRKNHVHSCFSWLSMLLLLLLVQLLFLKSLFILKCLFSLFI